MALRFNPYPYRNDRPSGSDTAAAIGQGISSLGQTAAMIAEANRQRAKEAFALRVQQAQLSDTMDPAIYHELFGPQGRPSQPTSGFKSIFQNKTLPVGPTLAAAGATDTYPATTWGRNQIKLLHEKEDRELARRQAEADISYKNAQADKTRREPSLSLDQQLRLEERRRKMEEADSRLNVPGYQRTGVVRPREAEAEKLRNGVARLEKFEKGVTLLKDLVDKHGAFEYFGRSGADMNGIATDLQLDAKELYNLGVLNGPDLMLIQKTIADPASWRSLFTRTGTRQAELSQVLERMRQGVASKMSSTGYAPENAPKANNDPLGLGL